jgi:hypothetical protein
LAEQNK